MARPTSTSTSSHHPFHQASYVIGATQAGFDGGQHGAGAPSVFPPKGKGTFNLETEWQIAQEPEKWKEYLQTESTSQFKPSDEPPAMREKKVPHVTGLPRGVYPIDFRTTKHVEFNEEVIREAGAPPAMILPKENGQIFFDNIPTSESFKSSNSQFFGSKSADTVDRAHARIAGDVNTKPCGYNIITGGEPLANNKFEFYEDQKDYSGKDYRRRRNPTTIG